jgi:RNA polymerase sigma factor (sigma-70 family)
MRPLDNDLPTRISLIKRAVARDDPIAWDELLVYYGPFINKILLRMGLRNADLDDVRQQICVTLLDGLSSYKRDANGARFRNWLSTVIRNTAINWLKKQNADRKKLHLESIELDELHGRISETDAFVEAEWQRHLMHLALKQLDGVFSDNAFEIFAMSLEGSSTEEIAEKMSIRKESVYVLKSRVKARLLQEIKRLRYDLEGGGGDE